MIGTVNYINTCLCESKGSGSLTSRFNTPLILSGQNLNIELMSAVQPLGLTLNTYNIFKNTLKCPPFNATVMFLVDSPVLLRLL